MSFVTLDKLNLKNNPEINEDMIQKYISDNPAVLGLGELTTIKREKIQPSKGRIDIILQDDDNNRYEVEVQLGATDPSHIIRTIEYWDVERKRSPQYDHCAVIVAEEITGRFLNVISLFNGTIPLIAIQLSAYKNGEDKILSFTKVLDRVSLATEDEESYETTDRAYWESRSTPKMLKMVDNVFLSLDALVGGYELKYNKFYIGISKNGMVRNFISFKPKKNFMYLTVKGNEDPEQIKKIEDAGFDVQYGARWKQYDIKINSMEQFQKNKDLFIEIVKNSMDYFNIDYEI